MELKLKLVLKNNLCHWCYAIIFLNTVITTIKCQYDDAPAEIDYIEADVRPMPPELLAKNKTIYEEEMEECMNDYVNCHRSLGLYFKNSKICAINLQASDKKDFDNMCHMMYESCKGEINHRGEGAIKWNYLHDGICP